MTLLLLRHGESEGNVLRVIQGWADYALTARGRQQAEFAAARLASAGAVALYTSPLQRAAVTAEAVTRATGLQPVVTPDFREYCFGEAQEMRWEEAAARWGLEDRDWGVKLVPGEEGMPAFRERVSRAFDALASKHAHDVAICVLHAGTLGAVVESLCDIQPHEHASLYTGNCGLGTFAQVQGRTVILGLNDQAHIPAGWR